MKTSHRQSMPFERGSSHPALLLLVLAAVANATAPGTVKADVLYDTTWMTDKGLYNETMSGYIGGFAAQAFFVDSQTADDVELADAYIITSVTGDFGTLQPGFVPADGILIEIFEDLGGFPSEIPTAAVFSSNYDMTEFPDIVWDGFLAGRRFTVDLSEEGITLGPGTWWVSIVPVDLSPDGEDYRQLRRLNLLNGNPAHLRNGGIDHGNGYPGFYGSFDDWTPFDQFAGFTPGDLAMKIEGTPVEANATTPDSFSAFRGFYLSGDLDSLLDSDDSDLCYNPGIVLNPTEAPITLDFVGILPTDSPSTLDVTIESSANTVGLGLTFSFWNYNTNSWDVVGTDTQSLNADTVRTFAGTPADHVEPGTGEVRTRYEVRQVGIIFQFPWTDCIDQLFWTHG